MTGEEAIWKELQRVDPALWNIKLALETFKVNPEILPRIIRAISAIGWGTGYGKVQIFLENRMVSSIKPEENDLLNKPALNVEGLSDNG